MSSTTSRLLVVDDNDMNRDVLARQLQRSGFVVSSASSGTDALDILERHNFDLILLDVMMPEMDGLEVLERLRQTNSAEQLPVIMVTAHDHSEDMVRAFQIGANDYVMKPIDYPVVWARIHALLTRRNAVLGIDQQVPNPADAPTHDPDESLKGRNLMPWDSDIYKKGPVTEAGDARSTDDFNPNDMSTFDLKMEPVFIDDDGLGGVDTPDAHDLTVGARVGNYTIEDLIGRGAMGVVYLAHHELLDQRVALKILPRRYHDFPEEVARFQREARAAAKVEAPHVVPILDVGHWASVYFIAMPYIEGTNAHDVLAERGPIPWREATRILADTLRGLAAVHQRGLVHRDIKPGNILLDNSGQVLLADFGMAKVLRTHDHESNLTSTGAILGTPHYMSPEQANGKDVDARSDIYSAGATYYTCLTAQPPFPRQGVAILYAHCTEPVPDPRQHADDIPEPAVTILRRAMEKDPADRYPNATEMLNDLDHLLQNN